MNNKLLNMRERAGPSKFYRIFLADLLFWIQLVETEGRGQNMEMIFNTFMKINKFICILHPSLVQIYQG